MSREMFKRANDPGDISFFINGKQHTVLDKFPPSTTLNDYIRDVAGLKGTKIMCKEAGCGCCAVTVTHASNGDFMETMSINSCMCPLYSADGWQITTVEGIGNSKEGFHPIQKRLVKHNGTQCGYCSPGFVMSMYGLLHEDLQPSQQEIEDSFDGHLCRCTGYRSILDAMKSFAVDSTVPDAKCIDIEDLNKKLCHKTGEPCRKESATKKATPNSLKKDECHPPTPLSICLADSRWYRPVSLEDLAQILTQHQTHTTTMIFGNTASGIFKHEGPYEVYIDLRAVKELYLYKEEDKRVIFGGGTTLTKLKDHLKAVQNKPGFHYCSRVIRHLKVLASVLVRNAGSMAGNLMIKHAHPDFPSDLFTILEAIGANVDIFDSKTSQSKQYTLMQFLREVDMKGQVIAAIELPAWNKNDYYRSFKITPRWQNAHAYVNAAFKMTVNERKVVGKPCFVVGGVNAQTVHAVKAEEFIANKTLSDEVINETLKIMYGELHLEEEPVLASPQYRRQLAVNLLYKTLLEVYRPSKYNVQSGADSIERPLSSGLQTFQEKSDNFPLRKPIPKITAPLQTSGEAEYVNDIPNFRHELSAALVVSSVGVAKITNVDTLAALQIPGVVGYIGSDDIPKSGVNNYIYKHPAYGEWKEELFATQDIEYAGQLIGIILAETPALAEKGARKVKVVYEDVQTPIVDLQTAIEHNSVHEGAGIEKAVGDVSVGIKEAEVTVEGEIHEGTQYHFYIENQVALCVPTEDGLDIYAATQVADMLQGSVGQVLGKPMNYVNVIVPRLGGSFGGKVLHSTSIASAAAVAVEVTGRPVRLCVDLSTNMKFSSKRFPIYAKYKAGCDRHGKLQFIQVDIYIDAGVRPTPMFFDLISLLDQGYYCPHWKVKLVQMKTNKPLGAATRGPGSVPASLIMETIMEHLAKEMKQHPIIFKEINLYESGQTDIDGIELAYCSMKTVWNRLKQTAEVTSRIEDVNRYNKNNQWRKRGITMCAVKYGMMWFPQGFPTVVSIFGGDGTVTVQTTGVEMGQGLYTKVAQAVAYSLKVPLDNVKVKRNQNNVGPNSSVTGGSTASERCVGVAQAVAYSLKVPLDNVKVKRNQNNVGPNSSVTGGSTASERCVGGDAVIYTDGSVVRRVKSSWAFTAQAGGRTVKEVSGAFALTTSSLTLEVIVHFNTTGHPINYFTYMAGVVETEVDVLTGEFQVRRVDIMADIGESMNPTIDIGQIEGAFVMGLGAYLSEDLFYDKTTGAVLNYGTWEYKPPTTKDIPIDWRIHLLPDAPNPAGVLSSKAVGEPPIGLAMGALLSVKSAIECVREELTGKRVFLPVVAPYTVERIQQGTEISVEHLRVGDHN